MASGLGASVLAQIFEIAENGGDGGRSGFDPVDPAAFFSGFVTETRPGYGEGGDHGAGMVEDRSTDAAQVVLALLVVTAKALRTAPAGPAIAFSATAHQAHAAALLEGLTPAPSRAPAAALTAVALAQAQTAAAARHLTALAGVSGPLARLLASIAASDAALASTVRGVSR